VEKSKKKKVETLAGRQRPLVLKSGSCINDDKADLTDKGRLTKRGGNGRTKNRGGKKSNTNKRGEGH